MTKKAKAPEKGEIVLVRKHGLVIEDETEFAAIVTKVVENGQAEDKPVTYDIWATMFAPNNHLTDRGVIPHQSDTERDGTARWRFRDEAFIEQPYEFDGEDSPRAAESEDKGYAEQKRLEDDGKTA